MPCAVWSMETFKPTAAANWCGSLNSFHQEMAASDLDHQVFSQAVRSIHCCWQFVSPERSVHGSAVWTASCHDCETTASLVADDACLLAMP